MGSLARLGISQWNTGPWKGNNALMIARQQILRVLKVCFFCLSCLVLGARLHAQSSVILEWDPSPDTTVVGYHLYYGVASGVYTNTIDAGTNTSVTVPGLVGGVTYYFAVTAYDIYGLESAFSNEISYKIPVSGPTVTLSFNAKSGQAPLLKGVGLANQSYDVLASTNCQTWTRIGGVVADGTGAYQYSDAHATNSRCFYRLRQTTP